MLTINAAAQPRYTSATARAAPDPEPPDPDRSDHLDDRVEQQCEQGRDQEQEDDVKDAPRDDPRQDQQERKPDQLHPARNLDLRRRAGSHRGHRTPTVVRLQPQPGGAEGDPVFWPGVAGFAGDAASPVGLGARDRRRARAAGPAGRLVRFGHTYPVERGADLGYRARDAPCSPPPEAVSACPADGSSHAAPGTPGRDGRRDPGRGGRVGVPPGRAQRRRHRQPGERNAAPPASSAERRCDRGLRAAPRRLAGQRAGDHRDRVSRRRRGRARVRSDRAPGKRRRRHTFPPPHLRRRRERRGRLLPARRRTGAFHRRPRRRRRRRARTSTRRRTAPSSGCATTCSTARSTAP